MTPRTQPRAPRTSARKGKRAACGTCVLEQRDFKPGDLPPEGYLAWHEWAEVQRRAGIKQAPCGKCGRYKTPQEMSDKVIACEAFTSRGEKVVTSSAICTHCAIRTLPARRKERAR